MFENALMAGNSEDNTTDTECKCTQTQITELSRFSRETTGDGEPFTIDEEEFPFIPTYRPLRTEPQEIRLLSWKKTRLISWNSKREKDDVNLSLRTYHLDKCPEYIALSYTWGSNKHVRSVTVDGHQFKIRETLFEFLQSLPVQVTRVPFWLDVLCINQRDTAERNNQVATMSNIYRQATAVYSWLGDTTSNIASAHKFLDEAARPSKFSLRDCTPQERLERAIRDWHMRSDDWCEGFKELFVRKYWTRVWILQETILAKRLWFLAGQYSFSFDDIRTVQRAIVNSWQTLSHRRIAEAKQAILSIHLGRQKFASPEGLVKDDYFMYIRRGGCRDPRDIVFALHGVLPNLAALKADYNKTTIDVWWQACTQLFAQNFFDSIRLWEAMDPTVGSASVDIATAFPGEMRLDIYPWHYFHKASGSLLGTAALPILLSLRTSCPQHFGCSGWLRDGQKTHSNMQLQYFESFIPESSDVLLMCQHPGSDLWCAILRPLEAENAHFVGLGVESTSFVNYRHIFGAIRIGLDAKLVAVAKISLHREDDWKESQAPSQNITPGVLQLNGAASILLHQIKALFK